MENIQYRIILKDGETIDVNIDNVSDVEGAKEEIKESIFVENGSYTEDQKEAITKYFDLLYSGIEERKDK